MSISPLRFPHLFLAWIAIDKGMADRWNEIDKIIEIEVGILDETAARFVDCLAALHCSNAYRNDWRSTRYWAAWAAKTIVMTMPVPRAYPIRSRSRPFMASHLKPARPCDRRYLSISTITIRSGCIPPTASEALWNLKPALNKHSRLDLSVFDGGIILL